MTAEESRAQASGMPTGHCVADENTKNTPATPAASTKLQAMTQDAPAALAPQEATQAEGSGQEPVRAPAGANLTPAIERTSGRPGLEQELAKARRDLEGMVIKYAKSESDNLLHKNKIDELDRRLKRAVKDNESLANRVKLLSNDKNHLSETLSAKVAQLTVLQNNSLGSDQRARLAELEARAAELERTNEELRGQIDTYKAKEADLLDFSERLSMKQLLLQTELDKALENAPDYKAQCEQLAAANAELAGQLEELGRQLALATGELEAERRRAGSLGEQCAQLELAGQRRAEELENELKLVRRKCQAANKELLRRIRQYEPPGRVGKAAGCAEGDT